MAQRCLWEINGALVFHSPEVWQDRNQHDLMRDFEDEIDGYCHNRAIMQTLAELDLASGCDMVGENLRRCYAALVRLSVLRKEELALVDSWLEAVETAAAHAAS